MLEIAVAACRGKALREARVFTGFIPIYFNYKWDLLCL